MRWRDWLSARFGAAAIALSILLVGCAFRWGQAAVAIAVAAALIPIAWSRRVFGRKSPLLVLLLIATGLCLVQIVPLPASIVDWLAPTEAALRQDGMELVHVTTRSTISYDVPATLRALAYFLALLGIAIVALRISTSEVGRFRVLATVAGLCGFTAVLTGAHSVFGLDKLYGIFAPTNGPKLIGPLVNPNHLGCLMAVGATTALGLAMYRKQRAGWRAVWLLVAMACAFCTLSTLSRGATLALGAGAFVTIGALVAQRWLANTGELSRRRGGFLTSSLPIAIVATCTVIVVLYAGSSGISQQLSSSSLSEIQAPRSKFAAWRSASELIDESPWVGIGRGAFEPVFTRIHPASGYSTFSHVENEYLQAVIDFGVPGAFALALAAIWLVVVACKRWRDGPLAASALGGMVVVLLQSNVDYGIELLGVAAPFTAIAATLAYVPLRESSARELHLRRGARVVHIAALLVAAGLLCAPVTTSIDEDHLALADQHHLTFDQLREPLQRHPLDYFNYALAAQVMIRDHDRDAIRVLNHAMTLHPTHSGLHVLAAHLLYDGHHPEQATIEYALAIPTAKDRRKLLSEIVQRFPVAEAAGALPTAPAWVDELAPDLAELGHTDIEIAWLDHVLDLHPQLTHACDLLYDLAARAPEHVLAIVDDRRCARYEPSREHRVALARALVEHKRFAGAAKLLEDVEAWQSSSDQKVEGWLVRCDAELGLAHWDETHSCLRNLDLAGLLPPERAPELARRLEQLDQARTAKAH